VQLTDVLRRQAWVGVSKEELAQVARHWIKEYDLLKASRAVGV